MEFFKKDKDKATTGRMPVPEIAPDRVAVAIESPPVRASAPELGSGRYALGAEAAHRPVSPAPAPEPAPARAAEPPPPRVEVPASRPTASIPRDPPRSFSSETVINADASFKGDFSSEGAMRIEGKVEGKIGSKGRLTVGKGAQVIGEATVAQAVIEGTLKGNIIASERVELASSARVTGDIRAPRLVVGEGAVLQGNVSIGVDASSAAAPEPKEHKERSSSSLKRGD